MQKSDFLNICIDKQIWDWMRRDAIYPYPRIAAADRKKYILDLFNKVKKRTYYPQPALEYLTLNKGGGVLRVVPVLSLDDLLVYYYCTRKLEKYIAKNRIGTTFGGFGLSGKLSKLEHGEITAAIEALSREVVYLDEYGYAGRYVFAERKWYHEWGDFNKKLYLTCAKSARGFVAQVDISNFYDSISLDSLEYKLRKVVGTKSSDTVYLLMHFLKYWNRHVYFYRQQGVGLPQDLFGECSRILANHYLQAYDSAISSFCKKLKAKYFRYADDQFFFASDKNTLELIIAKASSLLMKEGLNFNQKKVKITSVAELKHSFAFDHFNTLVGTPSSLPVGSVQSEIGYYLRNRHRLRKGGISLLRRILNITKVIDHSKLRLSMFKRHLLSRSFLSRNYVLTARDYEKIYKILSRTEQRQFLRSIADNVNTCHYSNYLYDVKRFYEKQGISTRPIGTQIRAVRSLYKFER